MGLVSHALRGVFRNRRRSFAAVLGTLIVVGIVAGENIALDSSAWGLWETVSQGFRGGAHFSGWGPLNRSEDLRSALATVPGFAEISSSAHFPATLGRERPGPNNYYEYFETVVVRPDYERSLPFRGLRGSLSVGGFNVTMDANLADLLDLRIGDDFVVNASVWDAGSYRYEHFDLRLAGVLTPDQMDSGYSGLWRPPRMYLGRDTAATIATAVNTSFDDSFSQYEGWLDEAAVIDPYDVQGSQAALRRTMRRIDSVAASFGVDVGTYTQLESALQMYEMFSLTFRLLFLLLSLPVFLLALYLGIVGVDLGMAERRREIALLKARGASNGQVFQGLVIEAVALSILAAAGGLALGVLIGQALLSFGLLTLFAGTAPTSFSVSSTTVLFATLFAFLFTMASAYRPFRRASRLAVADGMNYYTPGEVAIHYRPTIDLFLIGLGVLTLIADFLLEGDSGPLSFLLRGVFLAITPIMPFLLAFGLSRFLSRGIPRLYSKASRVSRPFTGDLWPLVARNLGRNPRRASNVTALMALALVFGLMITLLYSSQVDLMERGVRADHGSDIRIVLYSPNGSEGAAVEAVEGVAAVAEVWVSSQFVNIVAVDVREYLTVVPPDDTFIEGGPWAVLDELATPGSILVSPTYAEYEGVSAGDTLFVPSSVLGGDSENYTTLTVVGIARLLPGTSAYPVLFGGGVPPTIYLDQRYLVDAAVFRTQAYLLVQVEPGVDPVSLGDRLREDYPGWTVSVAQEELARAREGPGGSFLRLMALQIALAIFVATCGLALILYAASLERAPEFASMVSRGASRRQVTSLLLGEGWVIIVIGLTIGVIVGLLTGWVFIETFTRNDYSAIQSRLVFSWEGLLVVVSTLGAMFLATVLIAQRAAKPRVVDILRQRGG